MSSSDENFGYLITSVAYAELMRNARAMQVVNNGGGCTKLLEPISSGILLDSTVLRRPHRRKPAYRQAGATSAVWARREGCGEGMRAHCFGELYIRRGK